MTDISLHIQWLLTSQSHGSAFERELNFLLWIKLHARCWLYFGFTGSILLRVKKSIFTTTWWWISVSVEKLEESFTYTLGFIQSCWQYKNASHCYGQKYHWHTALIESCE
jgi:hypothetical protein